ncbi:MAG: CPBP family intramembrane metalloprotease [Armatimonadetes bacterium]|nr:CPBP family intramembrane metalloprotease [Armatimonadota bacterium]
MDPALIYLIYAAIAAGAAGWVYRDAHNRGLGDPHGLLDRALLWGIGAGILLPFALPLYLLFVRPPGRLGTCAACGQRTIAQRAYCVHCGAPRDFDAPPAAWGLGEIVGVSAVFALTLPLLADRLDLAPNPALPGLAAYVVVQNFLFTALSLHVVRGRYALPLDTLGIRGEDWRRPVAVGLAASVLALGVSTVAEHGTGLVAKLLVGPTRAQEMAAAEHARDPVANLFAAAPSPANLAVVLILLAAIVPIGEEIFFRGLVYGGLRARWGTAVAVWVSALFFGAVHQQVIHFPPIFLLGVVLGYLRERTGLLLPGIIVHVVNNVIAVLSTYFHWDI